MFSRLFHRATKQTSRAPRSDSRASVRFESLETRRLLAADALAGGANLQPTVDHASELSAEVSTARCEGEDLLIVNSGDSSDFLEAGQGGGPHVKVFGASTETTADGDVDVNDFLIWQRDFGTTTNLDAVYSEFGSETSSDLHPLDQFSFNYEKIK